MSRQLHLFGEEEKCPIWVDPVLGPSTGISRLDELNLLQYGKVAILASEEGLPLTTSLITEISLSVSMVAPIVVDINGPENSYTSSFLRISCPDINFPDIKCCWKLTRGSGPLLLDGFEDMEKESKRIYFPWKPKDNVAVLTTTAYRKHLKETLDIPNVNLFMVRWNGEGQLVVEPQ